MEAPTLPPSDHFQYWGSPIPYFHHMYNMTWLNERAVEVAIATRFLTQIPQDQRSFGIEVGNVLGHYAQRRHEVIDLNEEAAWYQKLVPQYVYNWDLFDPNRELHGPWVISLSTIEHTDRPLYALTRLKKMVDPGGRLLVTFPAGAHEELDRFLENPSIEFTRICTISRTAPAAETWAQDLQPRLQEYGPWANTVAVLEWEALT